MNPKAEQQKQASHFAVRADVFGAVIKTLGTLPWEQVHQIMGEMMRSEPMTGTPVQPDAEATISDRNNTPAK